MKETTLFQPEIECKALAIKKERHQGITSSIMFFMVKTRPDIAFTILVISWFVKNPGYQYNKIVKTILHYLKGSKEQEITYNSQEELLIERYSDFDWADKKNSRKSISDFIYILNKGLVSWCLKKQAIIGLLFTKTEYIALTLVAKETTWLCLLFTKFGLL